MSTATPGKGMSGGLNSLLQEQEKDYIKQHHETILKLSKISLQRIIEARASVEHFSIAHSATPIKRIVTNYCNSRELEKEVIPVFTSLSSSNMSKICDTAMVLIYSAEGTKLSSVVNLLSGFFTLLATREERFLRSTTFIESFKTYEYDMIFYHLNSATDAQAAICAMDPRMKKRLQDIWECNLDFDIIDDPVVTIANMENSEIRDLFPCNMSDPRVYVSLVGIMLAVAFKQLNRFNYSNWKARCIRAFGGRVFNIANYPLTAESFPTLDTCQCLYMQISSMFTIRKNMLLMVINRSAGQDDWAQTCHMVALYARGFQMKHLYLITEYIVKLHPYLLGLPILRVQVERYLHALEKIKTEGIKNAELPYVRILKDEGECTFLMKKNFLELTYIALQIGKKFAPNLKHYKAVENVSNIMKASWKQSEALINHMTNHPELLNEHLVISEQDKEMIQEFVNMLNSDQV